jgi:hypothetical protein
MTMKTTLGYLLIIAAMLVMTSCFTEDPGPLQETERQYRLTDFDRLEIGDALNIYIQQGDYFEIKARGDRRNIDDLEVDREGNTLIIRFEDDRNRRHETYIDITMPVLRSANFSGASNSKVYGFNDLETLDIFVSGASLCQVNVDAMAVNAVVSGASQLNMRGNGDELSVQLSGASILQGFNYPVAKANLNVSGASEGRIAVSDQLEVVATGASLVVYRGAPAITSQTSDSSEVRQD